jgi:hypothetical protein
MAKAATRWCGAAALCGLAAAQAQAQSITTNFTGDAAFLNHRNVGVLFNVTALHPQGITIQSFDVHPWAAGGSTVEVEVFSIPGPYQGHEQVLGGWPLIGRAQVVAMGQGLPTPLPIGGIHIPGGQTRAIYINHRSGGVLYNTEGATVPVIANADVRLNLGAAQEFLFGGAIYTPRGFMGTVHYAPGGQETFGACCLALGDCVQTTEAGCGAMGGTFVGVATYCLSCPQPRGCCLPASLAGCVELQAWQCEALGGTPGEPGSWCGAPMYWSSSCGSVLHSRGGLINEVGTGFAGAHLSRATGQNNTPGLSASALGGGPHDRLADEFVIFDQSGWRIESIVIFGLISATATAPYSVPPESPFTSANLKIWNGPPGLPGSAIVAAGSDMAQTGWTGIYRVPTHVEPENTERPIMFVRMDLGGIHLPRGAYWVDYQIAGAQGSATAAVTPPMLLPLRYPPMEITWGMGRQLVSSGGSAQWIGRNFRLPVLITGELGAAGCYANCDGATSAPVLNVDDFTCFINAFAEALTWPLFLQRESYANCDQSTTPPVLNVDDFTCFINAFAQGCR